MKFNEKWLHEWIDPNINKSILYEQIINSGIEIESIKEFKPIFSGIKVGEIVECISDKKYNTLKVLKVDIGIKKLLTIVCKASNCREGIKVAVATVGSILPNKNIIDKRVIRNIISEGMLCSFSELGLFSSNSIIEIDESVNIGVNVNEIFSLQDKIIKVSSTPNRPDSLSILGLSRNIASMNDIEIPTIKYKKNIIPIQDKYYIDIQSEKDCICFSGRIIRNVQLNIDTPIWMKKRLFFSDMLSNNVVNNIINYVLIEIGQPIYMFNEDNIIGNIIIRRAKDKEEIILKEKESILLDKSILVIADNQKILSIPGNINSYHTEVQKNSKNIFLGSAIFNKKSICNIIKKFSSNKILEYYYYGIDSSLQNDAIEYATNLILDICGGISGPIIKQISPYKNNINNSISLYHSKINNIIGFKINQKNISNILYRLDYKFTFKNTYWHVIPPSWRFDIIIEEDVIGDIMRIYGYNNVKPVPLKKIFITKKKDELKEFKLDMAKMVLVNKGYYEIITYSFIDPQIHNIFFPHRSPLLISNPISKDMSCMRTSLWPGLLKSVSYNKNHKKNSIRLFESGLCFSLDKDSCLGVKQDLFLAAVISGNYSQENWYSKVRKVDFYDLKGDLESILESICGLNNIEFRRQSILGLHSEQSTAIYFHDTFIGCIGSLDPKLEEKLNFYDSIFVFEILFNSILDTKLHKIKEISKFPTSRRDIAILVSIHIDCINIIQECKNFFKDIIVEINLFDVYSDKKFKIKQKSLGISFIFQHYERTLKEYEINLMVESCIIALKKKFQIILRNSLNGTNKI
ncbi:phenylalanine--tRNA ligase subunit beta [Buchnera aphidicola]|uniref:phenylalanine--tRNA ligase subunit beta n=1 Tax=Buchnera aphidicola TaxID=9 RepID=UPI003BEF07BC